LPDLDSLAGQGNNALDEQLRAVKRVIEDHDLTAPDRGKTIGNPIEGSLQFYCKLACAEIPPDFIDKGVFSCLRTPVHRNRNT
jgi:hypothetical protein